MGGFYPYFEIIPAVPEELKQAIDQCALSRHVASK
jgi:hypothetical protein